MSQTPSRPAEKLCRSESAQLGASDLDVANIDVDSILLEGVAPVRTEIQDVATPFEIGVGKNDPLDCNEAGPDGFDDLTLKFDAQELISAIGPVDDGEAVVLNLTGELRDNTPVDGEDIVVIRSKR